MIDLKTETVLSLNQASKLLPPGRNGKHPHISTLIRAIRKPDGLEGIRCGSRWLTSVEALQRWCDRQTMVALPWAATQTPASRRKSAERATRELDALGL